MMNLDMTLRRAEEANDDGVDLRRLARDVGYELINNRREILKQFRAGMARVISSKATPFVQGYRSALLDVVAAYEAALESELEEAEAERLAQRDSVRRCLVTLAERPATPTELAELLSLDPAQISRILSELRDADLVAVWTIKGDDGRTKPHRLTVRGEKIANQLAIKSLDDATIGQKTATPEIAQVVSEIENLKATVQQIRLSYDKQTDLLRHVCDLLPRAGGRVAKSRFKLDRKPKEQPSL